MIENFIVKYLRKRNKGIITYYDESQNQTVEQRIYKLEEEARRLNSSTWDLVRKTENKDELTRISNMNYENQRALNTLANYLGLQIVINKDGYGNNYQILELKKST